MQNSMNQDQDQRKNSGMEDSPAMTIEFLRARLLAERSVSRTARQRADELAKRVLELEEQLKIVSLQRKKAEKATADVLAILENHDVSDFSEEFDSSSDQDVILGESKVGNSPIKEEESDVNSKLRRKGTEEFSGSELESSRLPGRSLSWKSSRDSSHSLEKKYIDSSTRRRRSFTSSGSSSPKQCLGKSCRQIRRRETRSAVEELNSGSIMLDTQDNGVATCSDGHPNCSEGEPEIMREGSENREEKVLLEGLVSGCLEDQRRVANGNHYLNGHGGDMDMEKALEHQAQIIGQYEAEEKAQREWEEKFRENNNSTPDSCEPGNHSDITEEERDDIKAQASYPSGTIAFRDQEAKSDADVICFSKESSKTHPNGFLPPSHADKGCLQDQKSSSTLAYESPAQEFAFPMAKGEQNQQCLQNNSCNPPSHSSPGKQLAHVVSSSHAGSSFLKGETSGSRNEHYALMPHGTPNRVGGVLDALQQARLSLKHNLNRLPLLEGGSVGKAILEGGSVGRAIKSSFPAMRAGDRMEIPVGCAGLFRVPTDVQFEATGRANFLGSGSRLSLGNYHPDTGVAVTVGDRFVISPYVETRSGVSTDDRFLTSPFTEAGSRVSTRKQLVDPYLDTGLPSTSRYTYPTYPSYPNPMPRIPFNEGFPTSIPTRSVGMPPADHFSFYNDHVRPDMYR